MSSIEQYEPDTLLTEPVSFNKTSPSVQHEPIESSVNLNLNDVYERVENLSLNHHDTSHTGITRFETESEACETLPLELNSEMPSANLSELPADIPISSHENTELSAPIPIESHLPFQWPRHRPILKMEPDVYSPSTTPPLPLGLAGSFDDTGSFMDRRQSWASTWLLYQQQAQHASMDRSSVRMSDLYSEEHQDIPISKSPSIHSHTSYTSNSSFNMYYCDDEDDEEEDEESLVSETGTFIVAQDETHLNEQEPVEALAETAVSSHASQYRIQLLMEILAFQRRKWDRECRNGREIKTRLHPTDCAELPKQPSPLEKRLMKMCQTLQELYVSEQHYCQGLNKVDDIHTTLAQLVDSRAAKDLEPIVHMLDRLKSIHHDRILPSIESLGLAILTLKEQHAASFKLDLMDVVQAVVDHLPDLSRELVDYKVRKYNKTDDEEYFSLYYVVNSTFDTLDKSTPQPQDAPNSESQSNQVSSLASRLRDKMSKKTRKPKQSHDNHLLRILSFRKQVTRPISNTPVISSPLAVTPAHTSLPRRVSSLNLAHATINPSHVPLVPPRQSSKQSPHRQYQHHRHLRMSIKELKFQLSTIAVLPFQRLVRYKAILERILFLASHPIPESACSLTRRPTLFTKPDLLPFETAPLCDLLLQCANMRALIQDCNACMTLNPSAEDTIEQPPSSLAYERTLALERTPSLSPAIQQSSLSRSLMSEATTLVTRSTSLPKPDCDTVPSLSLGSPETPLSLSMTSLSSMGSPIEPFEQDSTSPPMPTTLSKLKRSISRFFSKDSVEGGEPDLYVQDPLMNTTI